MAKSFVRHFAINAQLRETTTTAIVFCGRAIPVTEQNIATVERIRARDAEQAYEAAMYGREFQSRLAA